MLLADMGAEVIRIDRPGGGEIMGSMDKKYDVLSRGRRSVVIDLKSSDGAQTVLQLLKSADVLLEGFRPGVMERLGLGPEHCFEINPKLVYGRMTGWGQHGPLASAAGHDINYIALVGALHACGVPDHPPSPPMNLVGDFGGGSMFLLFGVLSALYEAQKSGKGQVIDAAMTDGTALLTAMTMGFKARGNGTTSVAQTSMTEVLITMEHTNVPNGKFISIASAEKKFYQKSAGYLGAYWA
jgi:Predicted acyl-CoA transferases/carnitine dehydratase